MVSYLHCQQRFCDTNGIEPGSLCGVIFHNGKVVLKVSLTGVARQSSLIQGDNLNDDEWHHLSVVTTKTEMKMKLDQLQKLESLVLNVTSFNNHIIYRLEIMLAVSESYAWTVLSLT